MINDAAKQTGSDAYIVGGYVRDQILGRPDNKDIDIVVVGNGVEFAEAVKVLAGKHARLSVFHNYGTAQLKLGSMVLEFVGARKESYAKHSRNPTVTSGTLADDLARRDFTINALAISIKPDSELIDLFGGVGDLQAKLLKTPLDPDITFSDDPLRMYRAIRFATQLGFTIAPASFEAIKKNAERSSILSKERIKDELNKIVLADTPSTGFRLLDETGLLAMIFPEFVKLKGVKTIDNKSHKDNFYHTLQVLDNTAAMSDNLWLRWAAILHDIGKPATQKFDEAIGWTFHGHDVVGARMVPKIFKRLALPLNEQMKFVEKLVLLHLRPIALTQEVSDSAIRRLLVDAGDDLDALMTLCKADVTSKNMARVKRYTERFNQLIEKIKDVEEKDKMRNWKPPVSGDLIMKTFNLRPGHEVGVLKNAIADAVLNGDIPNDEQAAYELLLKIGKAKGLQPVESI